MSCIIWGRTVAFLHPNGLRNRQIFGTISWKNHKEAAGAPVPYK